MAARTPKNAFFEFFLREVSTTPPPVLPIYPRGGDTSPSAPGRPTHHRQQRRPTQGMTHTPGRWTRCTGLRSIPDRPRRGDRDGGGCWTVCNVFGKVYNFGRLFLSIFIWTYFAESIDNPYIYGYNIIGPDKYGLQPH